MPLSNDVTMSTPVGWIIPFCLLLLLIATAPLFFSLLWHRSYKGISIGLGCLVLFYYFFIRKEFFTPVETLLEYFSFISLLTALFIISGGIFIDINKSGTAVINTCLLLFGAVLANIFGTTGASMLLIRPFIRINLGRIKAYHIIFFIFILSNVGGALTPIGDPPLFLGFLKGVPFFWVLQHCWSPWLFTCIVLAGIFFVLDKNNSTPSEHLPKHKKMITITGKQNIVWLLLILGSVFLDPAKISWLPAIIIEGKKYSYIRELIMLSVAWVGYKTANKTTLRHNEFSFEPIREVAYLFFGIFCTMIPALAKVSEFASSPEGHSFISTNSLYWMTGALSSILDNAPTYLNFLTAAMSKAGFDINIHVDVINFCTINSHDLMAISIAAVFFGAMTYIGNGPNFMVKSIAEQTGIRMPSFFGYILKYSLVYLLPVYVVVWWLFV